MRFDADQLRRLAQVLTDLGDISDRNKVHLDDTFGQAYVDLDGDTVPIAIDEADDGTRTYYVEVSR